MKKLFILSMFIVLVVPSLLFGDPIVLDNDSYHVYLADSYSDTVNETRERYVYSFVITNKKKKIKNEIKIKTYDIVNAFLTPDHLNVVVGVLPPGTNGRTPVAKYYQYNLLSLKQTGAVGGLQDVYFSPNKKYGLMRFTFNPYKANEFDALAFIDLTKGPPRLKWLDNEKEKIKIFDGLMDKGKKYCDLEGEVGWTPDDNEMAFVISWNTFNEDRDVNDHGFYLAHIKNLVDSFDISLKPVDFTKIGSKDSPWITKIDISKEKAILSIKQSGEIKKLELELPN